MNRQHLPAFAAWTTILILTANGQSAEPIDIGSRRELFVDNHLVDRLAGDGFVGRNVVDIGCGTAVLAMAAARIWPGPVLASDIDEVAVDVARANVAANGLADRVTCVEAAGFDHPALTEAAPFDLVFANILKGPLAALAPDIAAHLQPGGYAILSGLLNEQADEIVAVYSENGINLIERESIVDWTTLVLRNKVRP